MNEGAIELSTWQWWNRRRFRYNLGLIVAGLAAFVVYLAICAAFADRLREVEITAFWILFQAWVYMLAILIANLLYFLGPLTELALKPGNVSVYRKVTFNLGFWFSVLLPLMIPVLTVYFVVTGP